MDSVKILLKRSRRRIYGKKTHYSCFVTNNELRPSRDYNLTNYNSYSFLFLMNENLLQTID